MKVYIASSWKNFETVREVAQHLRSRGIEVDDFTDARGGDRYVFDYREEGMGHLDGIEFMKDRRTQLAFDQDKAGLDWADAVLLILPSGRSSHLEAGYAVGQGKKLVILGPFPPGEFDAMYGFAHFMTRCKVRAATWLLDSEIAPYDRTGDVR